MDDRSARRDLAARRGHRRRPVATARAAAHLAGRRRRCSARCCSGRSRSSTTRPPRSRSGSASRSSRSSCRRSRRSPVSGRSGSSRSGCGCSRRSAVTWLIVGRTLALESRINRGQAALSAEDRTAVLVTILLVAFLAFTGVAAMVPGGLAQTGGALPGRATSSSSPPATRSSPACSATARPRCGSTTSRGRAVGRRDVRGGDRHRRGGAPGDGDPAPRRAGPADARLLPVGRVHQHGARRAGATSAGSGRSGCSPRSA